MTKQIVITSDCHGNSYTLKLLVDKYPNAIAYLDCGDSEDMANNIYPFLTVKGNNDYYIDNLYRIFSYKKLKAYITHGHRMFLSKSNMARIAKEHDCNFFIHGHTHRQSIEYIDGICIVCPGSVTYPRNSSYPTYALINILDDDSINVEIKQL